jgi:hypothetical protein
LLLLAILSHNHAARCRWEPSLKPVILREWGVSLAARETGFTCRRTTTSQHIQSTAPQRCLAYRVFTYILHDTSNNVHLRFTPKRPNCTNASPNGFHRNRINIIWTLDFDLLGYDAASMDDQIQTFRDNVVSSSNVDISSKNKHIHN